MRSRNLVRKLVHTIGEWLLFLPRKSAPTQRHIDADYLDRVATGFSRVKPGKGPQSSSKAKVFWAEAEKLRAIADRLRASK